MKIVYATFNPAKLEEARFILQDEMFAVLGLRDFSGIAPVEETGSAYDSAIRKAV